MARQQLIDQAVPHFHVEKPGKTTGEETDLATQGSSAGKESLKISVCQYLWKLWWQEKHAVSQKFVGETHRILEHTQTH